MSQYPDVDVTVPSGGRVLLHVADEPDEDPVDLTGSLALLVGQMWTEDATVAANACCGVAFAEIELPDDLTITVDGQTVVDPAELVSGAVSWLLRTTLARWDREDTDEPDSASAGAAA